MSERRRCAGPLIATRLRAAFTVILAVSVAAGAAGCDTTPPVESAAEAMPEHDDPDPVSQPDPAEDIEADAERILAEMNPEWQAMLAQAEALQRRDQAQSCVVCHVDAADQWTGTAHDHNDVGCIECHGPSEAHAQDENNEVLPDELFARADVDYLCAKCHVCTRTRDEETLAAIAPARVCTDCHTAHAFATSAPAAPPHPPGP